MRTFAELFSVQVQVPPLLVLPLSGFGIKCAAALFFLTWFPFMIPPSLLSPRYQARPEACCRYSMEE